MQPINPSPAREQPRILVVEDDSRLASLVAEYLRERGGYAVSIVGDGLEAIDAIENQNPNLVVLDIMLPGIDGLEVCRRNQCNGYKGAVLMLTARGEDVDEVIGLEIGADDYVAKPARPRVLLARVQSLLRRIFAPAPSESHQVPESIEVAGLVMSDRNRSAALNGQPIELTTAEFDLLWFLARHAGQVVTRDAIFESVKGIAYDGIDRSIDLRVARLRRKLGDDEKHPQRIKSVRGTGYLMTTDPEEEA